MCPTIVMFSFNINQFPIGGAFPTELLRLRACFKTTRSAAARDFGCGQGGEAGASPQRAVTAEPTPATDKRTAARRVFAEKAIWLRCSSVEDPQGIFSLVSPRHTSFSAKTAPLVVLKQALPRAASPNAPFRSRLWKSTSEPGIILRASVMVHARPSARHKPRQPRRSAIV